MQLILKGKKLDIQSAFEKYLFLCGGLKSNKVTQIRIYYDRVEFIGKGVTISVKTENDKEGDVLCPSNLLKSYLSTSSSPIIVFTFSKGSIQCGSSTFQTKAIDVFPHGFLPSSEGALNTTKKSVQKLALLEINTEDYRRKGMMSTVVAANKKLKTDIIKALETLQEYNITYDDLETLVRNKFISPLEQS